MLLFDNIALDSWSNLLLTYIKLFIVSYFTFLFPRKNTICGNYMITILIYDLYPGYHHSTDITV